MRFLSILALSAAVATAQNVVTTTFASNNGGANGGTVTFDLEADVDCVILDFDLNFGQAAGTAGTVDVYIIDPGTAIGNELNMAAWTLFDTANVAATAGVNQPSLVQLNNPLLVLGGTRIGVAIVCGATLSHSYTNGAGNDVYGDCPMRLITNSASNAAFGPGVFFPRAVNTNMRYSPAPNSCAEVNTLGSGCLSSYESVYEILPSTANDLGDHTVDFLQSGAGFVVQAFTPSLLEPVGTLGTPELLTMPDDGAVIPATGTLGVEIGSNGWMCAVAGLHNPTNWIPNEAEFLNSGLTVHSWTDLEPNAAGTTEYEEDAANGIARVTFTDVPLWGTPDLVTIQLTLDTVTGSGRVSYGAVFPLTGPEDCLVGMSTDTGTAAGGSSDLSSATVTPILGGAADELPLALDATSGRPVQSGTPSMVNVTTNNISASSLIHIGWLGLSSPGLPLQFVNPAIPGDCVLHADVAVIVTTDVLPVGSVNWNVIGLPDIAVNNIVGTTFYVQSAAFDLGILNANTRVSNGLEYIVGDA